MIIRHQKPEETEQIAKLIYNSFLGLHMLKDPSAPVEDKVYLALLESGKLTLSIVALIDDVIVGHVAFSPIVITNENDQWYGLGPVCVEIEHRKRGIGSKIIKQGIEEIKAMGGAGVVLVGEPAYYNRFGFYSVENLEYPNVPSKYVLVLSFSDKKPTGTVLFDKAFDQ